MGQLAVAPIDFQKILSTMLVALENAFTPSDDILIVSKNFYTL